MPKLFFCLINNLLLHTMIKDLNLLNMHYNKPLYEGKNHHFKDSYDKIYTIGYYSGFYCTLRNKFWAYGGSFKFSSKDEEEEEHSSRLYQINLRIKIIKWWFHSIHQRERVWNNCLWKNKVILYFSKLW
jgi:hypothetical protein